MNLERGSGAAWLCVYCLRMVAGVATGAPPITGRTFGGKLIHIDSVPDLLYYVRDGGPSEDPADPDAWEFANGDRAGVYAVTTVEGSAVCWAHITIRRPQPPNPYPGLYSRRTFL